MSDNFTVTVDKYFLANALTSVMQMRGDLEDEESVIIDDLEYDEDNEHIVLNVSIKRMSVN